MLPELGGPLAEQIRGGAERDAIHRGFLGELAAPGQTALVVFEDVHWADEATLDLLRFLARRLDRVHALVIATYRTDEVGDRHPLRVVLGDLATTRTVGRLALEPLSLDAVRTLCEHTDLDPVHLHARTGGNPFHLTEVISSGGHGIPATVRDAVLARAARLTGGARQTLDAAAVLGFRFDPALLEAVCEDSDSAVDLLITGGLLRMDGDRLRFHHELAREAILEVLVPHRRTELHLRALRALRDRPAADVGHLAHHAEGAGDAASVLEYAIRAARRARLMSAHRDAATQFARALRFADTLAPVDRAELWEAYSWECVSTDQWNEATGAGRERVALWRTAGDVRKEGEALSFLVGCLASTGEMAAAEEASAASIALLETLPPGPELAEAYGMRAYLRTLTHDTSQAAESARRVLDLMEGDVSPYHQVMGYSLLATAGILAGEGNQDRYLHRAVHQAREADLHWAGAAAYFNIGTAWVKVFDLPRAEKCLTEGLAHSSVHQLDGWFANMLCWLSQVQLHAGRWEEAQGSASRVIGHAHVSPTCRAVALQVLGRLGVRRGTARATEMLDEAMELARATDALQFLAPIHAARAEKAWLEGDAGGTRREARAALHLALEKRHPWLAGELICWLRLAGDPVTMPPWVARPFALIGEGRWSDAADEWRRLGCPYEAALALAATGEPDRLRSALADFTRMGARPAERSTMRLLRARGVRGIPRGPRASTIANPRGLTMREVEVLSLVAEGLPNSAIAQRLFLSTKTVGHHVSAVLAKLGARSRAEAAGRAAGLGLLQDREPPVTK